jgi:flagellar motility protein MotE (MotC chaperone)
MADEKAERKKIADERKKLKKDQAAQRKEAKKRAKELADQEAELDGETTGGGISMVFVTIFIILIWLAILAILVKLDVGGFGSNVLAPVIRNVPVINKILPGDATTETEDLEAYYGYTSLDKAVDQIRALELELQSARTANETYVSEIETLKAEVTRLKTFEDKQVEFERIKNEFYNEVVYAQNGPGEDEYVKYYESMDPATAESLYKQVIVEEQVSEEIKNYAQAYADMKPKQAAAIFEEMTDNLDLAAKILWQMDTDSRGKILGAMDSEIAAKITKIMEPDN